MKRSRGERVRLGGVTREHGGKPIETISRREGCLARYGCTARARGRSE